MKNHQADYSARKTRKAIIPRFKNTGMFPYKTALDIKNSSRVRRPGGIHEKHGRPHSLTRMRSNFIAFPRKDIVNWKHDFVVGPFHAVSNAALDFAVRGFHFVSNGKGVDTTVHFDSDRCYSEQFSLENNNKQTITLIWPQLLDRLKVLHMHLQCLSERNSLSRPNGQSHIWE